MARGTIVGEVRERLKTLSGWVAEEGRDGARELRRLCKWAVSCGPAGPRLQRHQRGGVRCCPADAGVGSPGWGLGGPQRVETLVVFVAVDLSGREPLSQDLLG